MLLAKPRGMFVVVGYLLEEKSEDKMARKRLCGIMRQKNNVEFGL